MILFPKSERKIEFFSEKNLQLRKHLRTRRLEDIKQVGNDRVIIMTFGSDPVTQYLIVEFYAGVSP